MFPDSRQLRHNINPASKRVLFAFLCLAFAAWIFAPGHAARAAINWEQDNAITAQTTVTASQSFTTNNKAGNLIVVATNFPWARTLVQVKDTAGNTYAKAMQAVSFNNVAQLEIWYAKNIVGGANTVKVGLDAAAGSGFDLYIHEYSGADLASPLDVTASSAGSGTALDSGPATINFPNELIFGFGENDAATLSTPGSTFTGRRTDSANITEDKTATTVGSYSATATINIVADWAMAMATFRPTIGQGVQISSRSDTLSDPRPSATSNHTIAFTSNNSFNTISTNATSTLTLAFPSGFSLSNIFCKDVDISFRGTATSIAGNFSSRATSKNCPGTATTWGLFIDQSATTITFYTPTAAAIYVATGTQVQILIGTNATFQDAASKWITNPSTGGIYTISVGGTFGGSGNMLVSINAGVFVQATVAESLSFTVSSVAASFPTTGILDNFNRADEDPLANGTWSMPIQTGHDNIVLVGNQIQRSGVGSNADAYWSASSFGPDAEVYVTVKTKPTNGTCEAVVCKIANPNSSSLNAYWGEFCSAAGTDTWTIYKIANNSFSALSVSGSDVELTAGDSIGLECKVGSQKLKRKSSGVWANVKTATDSSYDSVIGNIGVHAEDSSSAADDFGGGTVNSCSADDGAAVNAIATTATSVPFGIISPNTFYQGCQDLIVSTNAGNGYSVTVQESSAMRTADGRFAIPDTTCDGGTCSESAAAAWTNATKNGFGHTCFNQSMHDCNAAYSSGTNFRQVANISGGETAQAVMSSSTAATATGRVKYRLSAGAAQAAGTYTTVITYTILGTF